MNILIIDDNPLDISIISNAIKTVSGVSAYFSMNAESAINTAIEQQIDLIILDVVMPNVGGIRLKEALSRHPSTAIIPTIFVTADESSRSECYRIGCIDFLTKPLKMDKLINIIQKQSFLTEIDKLISYNKTFAKMCV